MTDASDDQPPEQEAEPPDEVPPNSPDGAGSDSPDDAPAARDAPSHEDRERLTAEGVEEKYDFENFGPDDMAEMSYQEWNAAFDHDSWITGEELLDRLEADLKSRVADRDVFAVVERVEQDTAEQSSASNRTQSDEGEPRLVAYSDEGYAVVYPDGTVEGSGTVLRDVKPSIALASMESYEVPEMPEGEVLPDPAEVPEGTGQLGNKLMQVIGAVHVLAAVALLLSGPLFGVNGQTYVIAIVAGVGFLVFGVLVFLLVANARLSDRFRAEEYRNRLRAVGMADDERPEFLPGGRDAGGDDATGAEADRESEGRPDDGSERHNGGPSGTEVSSASEGGT
jgi:hypothetical protein